MTLTSGALSLGGSHLTLGVRAVVSGSPSAANRVVTDGSGELRKNYLYPAAFTFPLGTSGYTPATLNFTNFSAAAFGSGAYAAVRLLDGKPSTNPSTSDYLNRHWIVTQSGLPAFSCNTTFQYLPGDVVGVEASLHGGKYDSDWLDLGLVNTANQTFGGTVTGFSTFGSFPGGITAVTLANFQALGGPGRVQLTWQTFLEIDMLGFNLYRSTTLDGERVQLNASLIPAQSLGLMVTDYAFIDVTAQPGVVYYYWIEAVELSGSTDYPPQQAVGLYPIFMPLMAR